jgi:hypothetical protein
VLFQVVRDHDETFAAQTGTWRDGQGLPPFIDKEFRGFLRCGWLAGGFARFRCDGCRLDRLVPFSCKGRAVCPSCGGRRMAERAAHLVDQVFPEVPVRQWVLTVPHRLRYLLAWNHGLARAVAGVFMQGVPDGRGGAVAIIQRFGAALNVNVHTHALVLDGVFAEDGGGLAFPAAPPPGPGEVEALVGVLARRIERLLARRRGGGRGRRVWRLRSVGGGRAGAGGADGRVGTGPGGARARAPVPRCGGVAPCRRRDRCRSRGAHVMLRSVGSIWMRQCACRRVRAPIWSGCAATPCVPRSPGSDSS